MDTRFTARRRLAIVLALCLSAFLISVDVTIVNVALPTLVRSLGATTTQLQWVVDAYSLVFAALVLAAGSLSDRQGRKGMLLIGLGVFTAGSLAGVLAGTTSELIAARAVMGLGAALMFPSTLSLLVNVFTERGERAKAIRSGHERSLSHTRPRHRQPSRSRRPRFERDLSSPPRKSSPTPKTFVPCQVEPAGCPDLVRCRGTSSPPCRSAPAEKKESAVASRPVSMPRARILTVIFGPTPWNFATGRVATKASAWSGMIANWPFGLR